jgi:type IV pilus assembly protein PilY1
MHKKGFYNRPARIYERYSSKSRVEAVYTIAFLLGESGERSLKHVAMYGSFDVSGRKWPGGTSSYPFQRCDNNRRKGSYCNPIPASHPDWDKNGDGVPDTFFSAKDALALKSALQSAIVDIVRSASSGATVATLASRSSVSSVVIQPYFYPSYLKEDRTTVDWIGFLRGFWIGPEQNLREDTVDKKILNIGGSSIDKIFQMFFDDNTQQTRIVYVNEPTTICKAEGYRDINEAIPVFNSGCILAQRNLSRNPRNILVNRNGSLIGFSEADTSLVRYLRGMWSGVTGATLTDAATKCIMRYLKGENVLSDSTCRNLQYVKRSREVNIKNLCNLKSKSIRIWRLGDILHSTPSVISNEPLATYHLKYNDRTYFQYISDQKYRNRTSYLFVGANDGMLHVFRIGYIKEQNQRNKPVKLINSPTDTSTTKIGVEEWAFIPQNALPYLVWYGHPGYCHIYTVDYRFLLVDASVKGLPSDQKTKDSWRTLLVGTMGFGGKAINVNGQIYSSSVFVLDLTDWLNGRSSKPALLWERRLPDGTLTTSFPAVIKVMPGRADVDQSDKNGEWYLIIGSGPLDPDGERFTTGRLYIYELEDNDGDGVNGELVKVLTIPAVGRSAVMAVGDPLPVDVDRDYRDDVIYFGAYGKQRGSSRYYGAFYRLPLREGNIYKSIGSLRNSDISPVVNLAQFSYRGYMPPVFAAPDFTRDEHGHLWVYFGTGRYLSNEDEEIMSVIPNYFFGIKDQCWDGSCRRTYSRTELTDSTNTTVEVTITQLCTICTCDEKGCSQEQVVLDTTFTEPTEVSRGWYIKLPGEAVISQPLVFGGVVDFLSLVPPQKPCDFEGKTKLYALYYKTGTPYPRPSIISPQATRGRSYRVGDRIIVQPSIEIGTGTPPLGNPFEVTSPSRRTYFKFIQISSGMVSRQKQQTAQDSGFLLWLEK